MILRQVMGWENQNRHHLLSVFGVGINFTRFLLSPQRLQSVMEGFNEMQLNPQWRTKVRSTKQSLLSKTCLPQQLTPWSALIIDRLRDWAWFETQRHAADIFPIKLFSQVLVTTHHVSSGIISCFPWLDILSRFRFSTTVRDFHTKTTALQTLHLYLSPTYLRVEIHHQSIASLSSNWEIDLCHQGYF